MTTLGSNTRPLALTAEPIARDEGGLAALAVLARYIERGHRGPANHRQEQQTGTDPAGAPDRAHHRPRRRRTPRRRLSLPSLPTRTTSRATNA
jgi:hypothetical protein